MNNPRVIALLLAGGYGLRMKSTRPKQFIETDGESVLLHTMKAFERHPLVDEIWVVCNTEWESYVANQARIGHITKFNRCLASGTTSYRSLMNGIKGLMKNGVDDDSIVLVHESVRPFVSHQIISSNILTCGEYGNAVTAIYSHESYARTNDGEQAIGYMKRDELMRVQTPITFPLRTLLHIAKEAENLGIYDSQSLFTLINEIGGIEQHIVEGSMLNFKITLPIDVEIYNRLRSVNYD